ncbi:MAG TPA: Gfo/Idh/MocA family oxidoreductase [Candidatus Nanopelagicales bacterium]
MPVATPTSAPIGYAIVGASSFAQFCLDAYRGIPDLRPVAVWSRSFDHAAAFAERNGLVAHPHLHGLLADPGVTLVHVASTPERHAPDALAALASGRHVLVEKPLATSLLDGARLVGAARANDVRLGVDFMMRFGPLWRPVATILEEALLGAPIRADVLNCAGDDGLPEDHWFWDPQRSGGILIEHGVHFLDLLGSWFGPGRVTHGYAVPRPGADIIDQVGCEVRHADAVTVGHYHGFHQSRQLDRQQVRIVCELGELVLEGWVADRLRIRAVLSDAALLRLRTLLEQALPGVRVEVQRTLDGEDRRGSRRAGQPTLDHVVAADWASPHDQQQVYAEALAALMRDMLQAVRDPEHHVRVSGEDGLAALRLAVAGAPAASSAAA